jgi:Predicted membrane protein
MKNLRIKTLVECAVMIALATVLSVIKVYEAPLGGSVTLFSMIPIILISFRHDIKWALGSAFVYSIMQLLLGLGSVSYVPTVVGIVLCIFFDYILAFTVLGFAGLFKNFKADILVQVIIGSLFVCVLRYVSHVVSGAVVWYEITKLGGWNDLVAKVSMWPYSLIYNAQYMVPETIITVIGAPAVAKVMAVITKKKTL